VLAENSEVQPLVYSSRLGGVCVEAQRAQVSELVAMLGSTLRQEAALVEDKTGLVGDFDIRMCYSGMGLDASESGWPTMQAALEKDLGVKLEKGKAMVEVLVVDSVIKIPTEN
jgi:uncharacterized protein (TIGR03435 family)